MTSKTLQTCYQLFEIILAKFVTFVLDRCKNSFNRLTGFNNTNNRCVKSFHITPHRWFVRSIIPNNEQSVKKIKKQPKPLNLPFHF